VVESDRDLNQSLKEEFLLSGGYQPGCLQRLVALVELPTIEQRDPLP
jgi:hypothetical protein